MTEADPLDQGPPSTSHGERVAHLVRGTLWGLLGEGVALPTGLVVTAFLTRRFDPEEFGVLALAMTLVVWLNWTFTSPLNRSAVKLVSEADVRPAAIRTVLLTYTVLGIVGGVLVLLSAGPVSAVLGEPLLAPFVRLLALETFFVCVTVAHRMGLVGTGQFAYRAGGSALRWSLRMILIVVLVEAGLSLYGVILGGIGSWIVELGYCRARIRPSLLSGPMLPIRPLLAVAGPLVLIAFAIRFLESADLFFLQGLSRSTVEAGYYGAARSLALAPGLLGAAASMPVLATLGHLTRDGHHEAARALGRNTIRVLLMLAPLASVASGSAREIVGFVMGSEFGPAAGPMAVLLPGVVALLCVKLAVVFLTAADRPRLTMTVGLLLPVVAAAAYVLVVPRFGGVGVAAATTAVAGAGALVLLLAVERVWSGTIPLGTASRAVLLSGIGFGMAVATPLPDVLVIPKLAVLSIAMLGGFVLMGELSASERELLRGAPSQLLRWLRSGTPS